MNIPKFFFHSFDYCLLIHSFIHQSRPMRQDGIAEGNGKTLLLLGREPEWQA